MRPASAIMRSFPPITEHLTPTSSDATKALRALTRAREDLVGHRVAVANELRALASRDLVEPELGEPGQ